MDDRGKLAVGLGVPAALLIAAVSGYFIYKSAKPMTKKDIFEYVVEKSIKGDTNVENYPQEVQEQLDKPDASREFRELERDNKSRLAKHYGMTQTELGLYLRPFHNLLLHTKGGRRRRTHRHKR
jgi:hypothetical protein